MHKSPLTQGMDARIQTLEAENAAFKRELKRLTQLQDIISNIPIGLMVTDDRGGITWTNAVADKLFALPSPYEQSITLRSALHLSYSDGAPCQPEDLPLSRSARHGEVIYDREMIFAPPGGQVRHLLVNTAPIVDLDGIARGAVGLFQDISQRRYEKIELQEDRAELKKAVAERTTEIEDTVRALEAQIAEREQVEADLRHSKEVLRQLSRRTLETLETDRQCVAKELHDSIGASLAAIKFSLEEKLAQMEKHSSHRAISLETILGYLTDTIKETKRISARLRPSTLDDLGLLATLSWYVREFSLMYGNIDVQLDIDVAEEDIPNQQKIVFYRIIQEAMNNAAKHGKPHAIRIHLNKAGHGFELIIEDDGSGFDIQERSISKDPLSGHGLQGMRERANICGGSFDITSRLGVGTRVYVSLPMFYC